MLVITGSFTPKQLGNHDMHEFIVTCSFFYELCVLLAKRPTSYVWCRFCCVQAPSTAEDDVTHVKYYRRMSESDSNIELGEVKADTNAIQ